MFKIPENAGEYHLERAFSKYDPGIYQHCFIHGLNSKGPNKDKAISIDYICRCFEGAVNAIGELQKEVEELKKELEPLKIKRQTEDEFRAEIWQAIEMLQEKNEPAILESLPDYQTLYEKEKEKIAQIKFWLSERCAQSPIINRPATGYFAGLVDALNKIKELDGI